MFQKLFSVVFVEDVAAFGAELRRILGVFGFPAAFVALVKRCALRLFLTAVWAELAFVYRAAGARPAFCFGLLRTAFCAEVAAYSCAASTLPTCCRCTALSVRQVRLET